jgi:predicted RNA binding protein YcfA (HicA-like mRNA interferase family)
MEVVRDLQQGGFIILYVKGSHYHLRHKDDLSRRAVVPVHAGRIIKPKVLQTILRGAGLSIKEFIELL